VTVTDPATAPFLLMTPGPTRVPERVLRAGARPMLHHRTPEFSAELAVMLELLRPVFGTTHPVLPVHTTGRGAMEATVCNLFSSGDEIAVCCNGSFGEMWARLAVSYGLVVHRIAADWARSVDPGEVDAFLSGHPGVRAVAIAYCDTSTGVRNDVAAVCKVARAHNVLALVDAVSALAGMPFAFDEWEADVAITASQKCLMSSPGLAFAVLSERAWAANATARLTRNYWDFAAIRNAVTKPRPNTPGTTPVHLVLQVAESLRMLHEEGLVNVQRRHEEIATATRTGARRLGLPLLFPDLQQLSPTVTALAVPPGVGPRAVRDEIKARGILTAAAIGKYETSGFRIGHMGDIRLADVERTLAALDEALTAVLA
jgi:aspartate aminotransferase-like enzyme